MEINGLTIPPALLDAIANGEWAKLSASRRLTTVFPRCKIVHPSFYDVDAMNLENANWADETDPVYVGSDRAKGQPGTIDPRQSVLIADLGPDRPIALDYRSGSDPSVVYLAEDDTHGWLTVASNVESFLKKLLEEAGSM